MSTTSIPPQPEKTRSRKRISADSLFFHPWLSGARIQEELTELYQWVDDRVGDAVARLGVIHDVEVAPVDEDPPWATDHVTRPISDSVQLRVFGDAEAEGPTALVVTPQVNHSSIADFAEDQSLVRTLMANGMARVGVTDWLPPPSRPYGIDDSIDDILACQASLGGPVHLIGLCQGGWQSAIVAATSPEVAASLTMAAAPIDTHAGDTPLHLFSLGLPMAAFRWLVAANGGVARGKLLASGFDLLRPFERFVGAQTTLYLNGLDAPFRERYGRLRAWYRRNKDVAGKLYLEAVRHLFKDNRLFNGTFELQGEPVSLGAIRCPVVMVAGARDHITPVAQVTALADKLPHSDTSIHVVDAGHIGVFMGRKALQDEWPRITAHLVATERSTDQ